MCRISHAYRRHGRYVFRRRVHFQNLISFHATIALRTASPSVARQRAILMSARFEKVRTKIEIMRESGSALTGEQIEVLFRRALEDELGALLNDA